MGHCPRAGEGLGSHLRSACGLAPCAATGCTEQAEGGFPLPECSAGVQASLSPIALRGAQTSPLGLASAG